MTTKLILKQEITEDRPEFTEITKAEFEKDIMDVFDFFDYLIRFALACGYYESNVEDAILRRASEVKDDQK
jgi:hypothetical protein